MNKLSLLLLPFPLAALADGPTVLVPEPLFFENREAAQMPSENLPEPAPAAPLSDGLSPQDGLEAQINHAVFRRDWQALPPLLARYRNLPARDQTLYDYALGALPAPSCAIRKQSRCIAALSGGIPIWPIRVLTWA